METNNPHAKFIAKHVVKYCYNTPDVLERNRESPEPIRHMVYEWMGEQAASDIDGSLFWSDIVDEIEEIY